MIALLALAVRIVPAATRGSGSWAMEPNGDSAAYLGLANGIKRGCGFAFWTGTNCAAPETNRTPAYPLFVALIPGLRTVLIAQGVLWSLLCFLVGDFTASVAGAGAGYCAAGIIAADIPSIVSSNEIMSETLFMALLVGAVLVGLEIIRSRGSAVRLCGLAAAMSSMLGLALLVRPIAEFLIPLFIAAPLFMTRASNGSRVLMSTLAAAGPVLCATVWSLRNYSVAGVAAISTIGGLNFFYYRAVGTLAFASHAGWAQTLARTQPLPDVDLGAQAWSVVAHHPFAFMAMTLWSFSYLCWVPSRAPLAQVLGIASVLRFEDPGSVRLEAFIHQLWAGSFTSTISGRGVDSSIVLLSLLVLQLVMIGFTWAGVALALRKYAKLPSELRRGVLFAVAIAMVTLLLASGPEAVARFRVPAMPLLAFLAGVGWFGNHPRRSSQRGFSASEGELSPDLSATAERCAGAESGTGFTANA